jgi:NAD(P)-dependent dehydrogenase (short-subunit alcohol dehydrogenase family)/aryl carrier-like protein
MQEAETLGPVSALRMVQALDRARLPAHPKLWLISRGAQPVACKPGALSVLQSPLWGLGRTIAIENPDFWGGMVDLDPNDSPPAAAARLLGQLLESKGEDQMAFRNGRLHDLRLARRTKAVSKPQRISVRSDATYLITGGLGGIGLIIGRWLVGRGARHLILAGRSSIPDRREWDRLASGTIEADRINGIRQLEQLGANVQTFAADMANEAAVNGLISHCLRADQPPLRGVFHAAGITQNESLVDQSEQQMRDILGAKMVGGWLLHRLLADVPLELFVLFSSAASILSSPRLGSYSAANMFLDVLAHHRRASGKIALSINWGPWAEAGMAARLLRRLDSKPAALNEIPNGVGTLSTQGALEALERLIEDGAVQTGVMSMDWPTWRRWTYGNVGAPPYLSLLIRGSDGETTTKVPDEYRRESILSAEPKVRMEIVDGYLAKQMARILKVPLATLDRGKAIVNMGFDSLMSIELKNQIETDLGVSIAMARLVQGPTILQLRDWVIDQLPAAQTIDATVAFGASIVEFEEGVL